MYNLLQDEKNFKKIKKILTKCWDIENEINVHTLEDELWAKDNMIKAIIEAIKN